jgi:cytochrome c peroxidase
VEQALPDAACVVYRVCKGRYGELFREVWGEGRCNINWPNNINGACSQPDGEVALSDGDREKVDHAYDRVALSVAEFEGSKASNAFTSKIDAHRAGEYEFNAQEELGRQVFRGKGQCVACHVGAGGRGAPPPLFTDFTYDNLGVPINPLNPAFVADDDYRDFGLAGFLESVSGYQEYADANLGKQKVPTLRNVGLGSCEALDYADDNEESKKKAGKNKCITKAYMHNGYFKTLWQVVHFYNTRDVKPECPGDFTVDEALAYNEGEGCWPAPEVAENVNVDELGNLGLSEEEEFALVAIMMAMSDGYMDDDED